MHIHLSPPPNALDLPRPPAALESFWSGAKRFPPDEGWFLGCSFLQLSPNLHLPSRKNWQTLPVLLLRLPNMMLVREAVTPQVFPRSRRATQPIARQRVMAFRKRVVMCVPLHNRYHFTAPWRPRNTFREYFPPLTTPAAACQSLSQPLCST